MNIKKIRNTIGVILVAMGSSFATNAQGIEFEHDLDSALAKAKAENKIVFVDFYTSWCAPCKTLAQEVFPVEKVGTFFNKQFINCKVQCDDKGKGVKLGEKYQINAYPTLMFMDKNGELIHSAAGGTSPDGLIELAKIALSPDKNLLSLIKEWNGGNREDEFVRKYFRSLKSAYRNEKANADFETYFNNLKKEEKARKNTFELANYIKVTPFTPVFNYIEDNKKDYYKTVGRTETDKYIADSYLWYLKGMIRKETRKEYEVAKAKFKAKKYPYYEEYAMFYSAFEVQDSTGDYNVKEYMKRGTAFLDKYGKNNDSYTLALTALLGNCTGRRDAGIDGIKWMEDLLARNRNPEYLDTYFYILWRNFHFEKALAVGDEIRNNLTRENKSTKRIDSQITMITDYRDKLAKKETDNKVKEAGTSN
ncbi:thioredoxin family protein [Pinibacter aurantiacus]|uniref:Thioredoxin family protein n=1 Tax=Pinibacter aurantiacus TaxID=2851599 RepID=A0A9E2SCQ2_9BACT|nr:thioredoxin fold domain-containing protein [Pinibacter aurantiacus]MBV4358912.1 thioredoxin family protein [Pinibacter aurantiacus]